MPEGDALSYCPVTIAPESKLSHMATDHYGFVPKLSLHEWKNPALRAKKPIFLCAVFQWSKAERCFSSVDVLCCKATCDDVRACVGACSHTQSPDVSTDAQRAKTSEEGFLWFLLK